MRTELQQADWDTLLSGDIHSSWLEFKNKVHELESKNVPTTSKSKQRSKPIWMTNKTLKLVQSAFSICLRLPLGEWLHSRNSAMSIMEWIHESGYEE